MLHLRIGKHLVDGVDRTARHARLVHQRDPLVVALGEHHFGQTRVQRGAVFGAQRGVGKRRIAQQIGRAGDLAKMLPQTVAGRGNVDVAVGGLEHAGARTRRMVVALLPRHFALDQITRRLEIQHENLRFNQRGRYPLALARALALQQRQHDAVGEQQPCRGVVNRDAHAHRPAAWMTGNRHQATHALRNLIHTRAARVWPILPEACNAAIDDARINFLHCFVIDAELVLDGGFVVLDHHVGCFRQFEKYLQPFRRFQIQRQALFIAMQILEIRPVTAAASGIHARTGRFDLDDVRAPVGKLAHGGRPRAMRGQIQYGKSIQWQAG